MIWPFKRRVTDEEFIVMVRQLMGTLHEVWEPKSGGMTLGEGLLASGSHHNALRKQGRALRKIVPERTAWRPVHNALNRVALYNLEMIRRGVLAVEGPEERRLDELMSAILPSRVRTWEAQSREDLRRLTEALPESDPIRSIVTEYGVRAVDG